MTSLSSNSDDEIVVYSYAVGIYSGRQMERLLQEHLPLMRLTAFECPDANTINRFLYRSDVWASRGGLKRCAFSLD